MGFEGTRRNRDAENAPGRQGFKPDDIEEKKETSEQREARNLRFYREVKEPQVEEHRQVEVAKHEESRKPSWSDWVGQASDKVSRMVSFLWEKKSAIGVSVLLAFAGRPGVEARGGTALRHLDRSNATSPHPLVEWKGFNNLSCPTAWEFDPNKVTPELLEHLRKVGVSDLEQHIQDVQQGRYDNETLSEQREWKEYKGKNQLKHYKEKIASLQARKEEVKASQKVAEHVSKLLAEGQLLKEQSSVPRRELDSPTPDNWGSSIVFIHGIKIGPGRIPWKGSRSGWNCGKYWEDAINFINLNELENSKVDIRTIGYYKGDTNCTNGAETSYSSDLLDPRYSEPCADYHADAGPEGTNDESLYHISCKFAQYLFYNFKDRDVILVAHSMGGIIVRETMYQMQENAGNYPFPDTIGRVTDVITFNTPHSGIFPGFYLIACSCKQAAELSQGSELMSRLIKFGQNPQISGGFTNWTVIGSECDITIQYANPTILKGKGIESALDMHASKAVIYAKGSPDNTCYNHGGAIHDSKGLKPGTHIYYCSTSDPTKSPCGTDYIKGYKWKYKVNSPHGLFWLHNSIKRYIS